MRDDCWWMEMVRLLILLMIIFVRVIIMLVKA
jgi:hypothetical protein